MTAVAANVLWVLGVAAYGVAASAAKRKRWRHFRLLVALGTGFMAVECALERAWFGAAWNAVLVAVLLGTDWWNRRGRRVAKLIGEKSRAVLAAVVAKAREAGSSPVPEGARA